MSASNHLAGTGDDHLKLVLALGNVGIWELDTATGKAWRNRRHDEIFGYPEPLADWTYEQFLDHVVPEDRERVDRLHRTALDEERDWAFECRIQQPDGARRWISAAGKPLRDDAGKVHKLIGHVLDITHTKRNEEHLRLVTNELNHRVRNMLAITRAMIDLSAKTAREVPTFASSLAGRVGALARTHDLLVTNHNEPVSIRRLFQIELGAFAGLSDRVNLDEQAPVSLPGPSAEKLSLIAHELTTNAIKHGALSNSTGSVDIVISCDDDTVCVTWVEQDGPRVEPPTEKGFGSSLLRRALGSEGSVDVDYRPSGLVCKIALASGSIVQSPPASEPGADDTTHPAPDLADIAIWVLEDEPLIAMTYEDMIEEIGARIVGSFVSSAEALAALDDGNFPDVAILDVNLNGDTSARVATRLAELGLPFIFTTGYSGSHEILQDHPDAPILRKPVSRQQLAQGLSAAMKARQPESSAH